VVLVFVKDGEGRITECKVIVSSLGTEATAARIGKRTE
jgi:hypothetical protein